MARIINTYQHCNAHVSTFFSQYEERRYDSGMMLKLWKLYVETEEVIGLMQEVFKLNFSLQEVHCMNPKLYKWKRDVENGCIRDLGRLLARGPPKLQAFLAVRKKKADYFMDEKRPGLTMVKQKEKDFQSFEKSVSKLEKQVKFRLSCWKKAIDGAKVVNDVIKLAAKNRLEKLDESISEADLKTASDFIRQRVRQRVQNMRFKQMTGDICLTLADYYRNNAGQPVHLRSLSLEVNDIANAINPSGLSILLDWMKSKISGEYIIKNARKLSTSMGSISNADVSSIAGFTDMPPMSVLPVINFAEAVTNLDTTNHFVTLKVGSGKEFRCSISPRSRRSIKDKKTMEALHISSRSRYYHFVYPTTDTSDLNETRVENQALDLLLQFGGFLYLDEHDTTVGLTGLNPDEDLIYFSEPFLWDPKMKAIPDERFQEVTIHKLKEDGAKSFAWLSPGESGVADHGAFAYKCESDGKEFVMFFRLHTMVCGNLANEVGNGETVNERATHREYIEEMFRDIRLDMQKK